MKTLITLTVLLIQHLVFSQTISPVLEHFTSVGGIDEWSLITGQPNTGTHGSELCVNVSGNYLDNQYYSFESPIYDLNLWSEVDLLFSVVQNTRSGDLLYLYYFDSADSQWWGWDISGLNGVYLVSVPITTILFSIDFNTNFNGNINGKYFHIDYIDIMDPSVSLPIELLFFSAIINDGKGELMWATESEINNDYFLIERSKDAEEWVEVITTKGSGNSNMVNGYFEIDNEPLMGVFYYRLTQVDFNGEKEIFNIVPVENITNGEGIMDVFPNPLTNEQTL